MPYKPSVPAVLEPGGFRIPVLGFGLTVYCKVWEFPKIGGTLFGVLIIRILLFRVLY